MTNRTTLAAALAAILVAACASPPVQQPAAGHVRADDLPSPPSAGIPSPVQRPAAPPAPKPAPRAETYSVVVKDVRVQDLLFALARDAGLNVDIHAGIAGTVTLNAIDQTLRQLLARIARQADMRYELDGPNLVVMPDTPFLRTYRIDYVNMSRDTSGTVAISTQITASDPSGAGSAGGAGNTATTEVRNAAKNRFWESLEKNIKDILRETDKILPDGSSETVLEHEDRQSGTGNRAPPPTARRGGPAGSIANSPNPVASQSTGTTVVKRTTFREAASVIANPETGIVVVRANSRQHEKVQEFIDQVMTSARRQVLIEATIAEVRLSNQYQQGIDWKRLRLDGTGFTLDQSPVGTLSSGVAASLMVLSYTNPGSRIGNISATLRLLDAFGTVKVLSSPHISVLNNQTALLKVVDNIVYFQVQAYTTTTQGAQTTAYTTTPHSVSIGLVMSVTPQISESDTVLLNLRPTISGLIGFKDDPNPSLAAVKNQVPEIRTRELESVLRVSDGDIAVLGGLMEDKIDYRDDTVPGISRIPLIGSLFSHRNDTNTRTELVVFLRPTIVKDASIAGDYRSYRGQLPGKDFFADSRRRHEYPSSPAGGSEQ